MSNWLRWRWALLGIGALIALGLLAGLAYVMHGSQQRSREDAIARLAVRSRVSAQLLSGTVALSTTQISSLAHDQLAGARPTPRNLASWERGMRSQATYSILVDSSGSTLVSRPARARPADDAALDAALNGTPTISSIQRVGSQRLVETMVPFNADGGDRRVLITATPLKFISPYLAGTLADATGSEHGGTVVLDAAGGRIAGIGDAASSKRTLAAVRDALERGDPTGSIDGEHFAIDHVGGTGWSVVLIAPEHDLVAELPDRRWPWIAFGAFALSLAALIALTSRAIAASARIEEARAAAVRANESKSRFLSHISHELKQPLAAIMGFSDILVRQPNLSEADRSHYASIIAKSGRTLEQLVSELLDISRIESGRVLLNLEATNVRMAVEDAIALNEPIAAGRRVQLVQRSSDDEDDLYAVADPMRLRQVLLNLVSNAVKYNRDGGVTTVAVEATDHATIRIAVIDEGAGISAEDMPKLFHPFERLDQHRLSRTSGTGLGLVISKGLVEAMCGFLMVESTPGVGSVFSFELTVADAGDAHAAATDQQLAHRARESIVGHVLYVEDEAANRDLVQRVLGRERPGIELETAATGEEGVRALQLRRPDLLLLDLNLPDMTGEHVLRRLRSNAATADVPVIVLSADASSLSVTRLLQTGADAYVTKPLDLDRFLKAVDALIERSVGDGKRASTEHAPSDGVALPRS